MATSVSVADKAISLGSRNSQESSVLTVRLVISRAKYPTLSFVPRR